MLSIWDETQGVGQRSWGGRLKEVVAHDGKATSSQTRLLRLSLSALPTLRMWRAPRIPASRPGHLPLPPPPVPALLVGHTAPGRPSDPDSRPLCPQEKRIASLDAANARLMSALTQLKERYSMQARNGISPTNPTKLQITENGEFRNSSNC